MQYKNLVLILFTILLAVFGGCKKNVNDIPSNNGQFTYDNQTYNLSHGILQLGYSSAEDSSYNIRMALLSSGLNMVESNGIADSLVGTGDFFIATFYSTSQTGIEPGEYTFSYSIAAGNFGHSDILIHYISQSQTYEKIDEVFSGTINVKKDGDTYDISMNMSSILGRTIIGSYKGTLKYYSSSPPKSFSIKN